MKEKNIKELIGVIKANDLYSDALRQKITPIIAKTSKKQELSEENKKKLTKEIYDLFDKKEKKINALLIKAYEDNFTNEEIVVMINFYKTPVGQSLVKKMPALTSSIIKEFMPLSIEYADELAKILERYTKK